LPWKVSYVILLPECRLIVTAVWRLLWCLDSGDLWYLVFKDSFCLSFNLSLLPYFLPGRFCECLASEIRRMLHDFFFPESLYHPEGRMPSPHRDWIRTLCASTKTGSISSLRAPKLASSTPLFSVFSEDALCLIHIWPPAIVFRDCEPAYRRSGTSKFSSLHAVVCFWKNWSIFTKCGIVIVSLTPSNSNMAENGATVSCAA
jgi:hypothetical protein